MAREMPGSRPYFRPLAAFPLQRPFLKRDSDKTAKSPIESELMQYLIVCSRMAKRIRNLTFRCDTVTLSLTRENPGVSSSRGLRLTESTATLRTALSMEPDVEL